MTIRRAAATELAQVRQIWQHSRYLYHNLGAEDLPALLAKEIALLAEERGQLWGFVCIQDEARPTTLPATAPNRAYVRALALVRGRAPAFYVADLINATLPYLHPASQGHLLIVYADADWLRPPLFGAGFSLTEEVQFFALAHLRRWQPPDQLLDAALQLQPAQVTDLSALAVLDAATFSPLWHLDTTALHELLLTSRLTLASINGELVGYTALSTSAGSAHLARLAIHPHFQGYGLGKQILIDALRYAQAQGVDTVMLNTQVHNRTAQQLYRSVGFRPTGRITPVLTRQLPAPVQTQPVATQPGRPAVE